MAKIILHFGAVLALCTWLPLFWQPLRGQAPVAGVKSGQDQKQEPKLGQTQTQNDQRGTKDSPLVVDLLSRPKSEQEAAEEKENDERKALVDRWTIGSAIVVALFTGLLVIVGWRGVNVAFRTLKAIDRQGDDTHRAILLTQRPKLIVRNIVIWPNEIGTPLFGQGRPVTGQFYVANIGGSEATVCESHCMVIGMKGTLPMERPYEGKNGNNPIAIKSVLPPGGVEVGLFSDGNPFPDFDPMPFFVVGNQSANQVFLAAVYVMGWIEYSDGLGFNRRTAFCRKYDPDKGRFFAIEDPDYEHAE
jgi:hypothetical protein